MNNELDLNVIRKNRNKEWSDNTALKKELSELQSQFGEAATKGELRTLSDIEGELREIEEKIRETENVSFNIDDLERINDYIRICEMYNRL